VVWSGVRWRKKKEEVGNEPINGKKAETEVGKRATFRDRRIELLRIILDADYQLRWMLQIPS
jgi:hypothetical protein